MSGFGCPTQITLKTGEDGYRHLLHGAVVISIGNLVDAELERQRNRIPTDGAGADAAGDPQPLPFEAGVARRDFIDGHVVLGGVLNRRVYKVADGNGYQACPDEKAGPDSHI